MCCDLQHARGEVDGSSGDVFRPVTQANVGTHSAHTHNTAQHITAHQSEDTHRIANRFPILYPHPHHLRIIEKVPGALCHLWTGVEGVHVMEKKVVWMIDVQNETQLLPTQI